MVWEKLNKPIIVGIDPGTTSGYAILDTTGRTIKTRSAKELDIKTMLSEITQEGTAIAIGTDKRNCPSIIQKFAANTGARIILPIADMAVREKQELTKGKEYGNDHERDALASAIKAYNDLQPLLEKIDRTLRLNEQTHLKEKVTKIVVSNNTSINRAIENLTKKEEPKEEAIKQETKPEKKDPFIEHTKNLEKTNIILKNHNTKLLKALNRMKSKYRKSITRRSGDANGKKTIDSLWSVIRDCQTRNSMLHDELSISNKMISNLKGKLLLKKMDNLSWEEYSKRTIKEGDILLVDDPNVYSERTLESLKEKVPAIIHNIPLSQKLKDKMEITLISAGQFQLMQNGQFGLVDRIQLEQEIEKQNILIKIIKNYKKERYENY